MKRIIQFILIISAVTNVYPAAKIESEIYKDLEIDPAKILSIDNPILLLKMYKEGSWDGAIGELKRIMESAIENKKKATIIYLLENGLSGNLDLSPDQPAIAKAAITGDIDLVKLFLKHGADISGTKGNDTLNAAIKSGNKDLVEFLLNKGININKADSMGEYAIIWAARINPDMLDYLIQKGADINTTASTGNVLSMVSIPTGIFKNRVDTVKNLLNLGANIQEDLIDKIRTFIKDLEDTPSEDEKIILLQKQAINDSNKIIELLTNEPKRRKDLIDKRQKESAKLIQAHLPVTDLANIISEYALENYQDIPTTEKILEATGSL